MTHDFDGEKYKNTSTHQKEWGSKLISDIVLSGKEKILDLGCGDGELTARLASKVPDGYVIGLDASPGMIETAEKMSIRNLEFQLMDINDIAFVDQMDLIFSNATLHWVHDHELLLKNCYTALKKNGRLRFNFAADGNCTNLNEVLKRTMLEEPFNQFFSKFRWPWYMPTLEVYQRLVTECSFREIKVWGENLDRSFPTLEAMTGWIDNMSIIPFLKAIDDEERKEEFRNAVVERMVDRIGRIDGTYFEQFRRINVYAKKK